MGQEMKFKRINARIIQCGDHTGQLECEVTFFDSAKEIKFMLPHGAGRVILDACADEMHKL